MNFLLILWLAGTPLHQDTLSCPAGFIDKPVGGRMSTTSQLKDVKAAQRAVNREYGKLPADSTAPPTLIWIATDRAGRVANVLVSRSSGTAERDSAAVRSVRQFEFSPATYNGVTICTWVQVPIMAMRGQG